MLKKVRNTSITIFVLGIVLYGGFKIWESTWVKDPNWTPEESFLYGSLGTELVPLVVFQVLPDIFPENFQPAGKEAGDWMDQFGFIPTKNSPQNENLPYGIFVSNYQPGTGKPSPVKFVGFSCAICHTSKVRITEEDPGVIVYGMGSSSMDLAAFVDALKNSFLNEKKLSLDTINKAYKNKFQRGLSIVEKLVVHFWLKGAREALKAEIPMRNYPHGGMDLRNGELFKSGPSRNQPMMETIRFLLKDTPEPDGGYAKIPSLYMQEHRKWAHYDGTIGDVQTRNALAALGVGANIENLRVPGILKTIAMTTKYVAQLEGPKYEDLFETKGFSIDKARAENGSKVYIQYCKDCHGAPSPDKSNWINGKRHSEVVTTKELQTDPARVNFQYYPKMADTIFEFFPEEHPLKPTRENIRSYESVEKSGYVNNPIESTFSRVPYLHNGSILTLAELINLKPRRDVFYRGANLYDPVDVGLKSPSAPDDQNYFKFDTSMYGNSNKGHNYPWSYNGTGWDKDKLEDLLEYLKTF